MGKECLDSGTYIWIRAEFSEFLLVLVFHWSKHIIFCIKEAHRTRIKLTLPSACISMFQCWTKSRIKIQSALWLFHVQSLLFLFCRVEQYDLLLPRQINLFIFWIFIAAFTLQLLYSVDLILHWCMLMLRHLFSRKVDSHVHMINIFMQGRNVVFLSTLRINDM